MNASRSHGSFSCHYFYIQQKELYFALHFSLFPKPILLFQPVSAWWYCITISMNWEIIHGPSEICTTDCIHYSSSYQVALVTLWDKTLTSRHGNSMRQDPEMGGTKNSTLHYCIAGWIILGQSIGDLGVRSCEYSERGKHYFYNRTIG